MNQVTMHSMNYIGRFFSNFKEFYNDINGATLTGAIDVIVVELPDGTYNCSPFHVRFGKIGVLRSREKVVDIEINGDPQDIHMKLGESGEAFFVEEIQDSDSEEIPEHLATSPIPVSHFEELYKSKGRRRKSFDLGEQTTLQFGNEVNDYTKRRYTASTDEDCTNKIREREFLKRQIGLGNIEVGETSADDLAISLQSTTNKLSIEDITKDDISEAIFKMDSLEMENKPEIVQETQEERTKAVIKCEEPVSETKNGKKKRRKKSVMKKKNSQRKTVPIVENTVTVDDVSDIVQDSTSEMKISDSATDRSSLNSNASEVELRDTQKSETEIVPGNSSTRKVLDPDFHFFSDTELATGSADSRSNSPVHIESVQSDTEFEVKIRKEGDKPEQAQSWDWGEFPKGMTPVGSPTSEDASGQTSEQAQHNSMLSSVFSFMKHRRHNSNSDGIYLADLSSGAIEPEVAALYFNTKKKDADADMDCESGNGPSLQSPNSVEGSKSVDSDFEEHKMSSNAVNMSLSLCGWDPEPNEFNFIKHLIPFSDLCNNPKILESDKLVVKIQDKYYNYKVATAMFASHLIYGRCLPQSTIDQLCSLYMPSRSAEEKEAKQEPRSYSWFSWRRHARTSRETTPTADATNVSGEICETTVTIDEIKEQIEETEIQETKVLVVEDGYNGSQSSGSEHGKENVAEEKMEETVQDSPKSTGSDKCKKTLRLSSQQIEKLNLRDGVNEVEFSVTTAYQGTTRCKCHLYKWKWDDKIVISDIDGTITRSDVLGHILPIVGKDWAQTGVAQLFNKIKDNGYKLLYLSARAIGQSRITREYLKSIKQGDLSMPDGPILLNPTSLITAFHREVIEKKPEQFKISCMSDIRALFPGDANPFYAGYGNRINDVWAYRAVGIPIVRIFTINPKGELKHELTQTFQSSYSNMSFIVDQLFPPLLEAANDYSQFIYWRDPLPAIEEIDLTDIK